MRTPSIFPPVIAPRRNLPAKRISVILNDRGVATARGGKWQATQVIRLLSRLRLSGDDLGGLNSDRPTRRLPAGSAASSAPRHETRHQTRCGTAQRH